MIRLILIFLLTTGLHAIDLVELKKDFQGFDASTHIYYINDKNNTFSSLDILKKDILKKAPKGGQLKSDLGPFWSKLSLKNCSQEIQNLILYNKLPGMNYIDVFVYKNEKLINTYLLGDLREQNLKEHLSRYSMFELILLPNEQVTIVSKVDNYNLHNISWLIKNSHKFFELESNVLVLLGIVAGFFLLFAIISFILFVIYRPITYLIIALHTLVWLAYILSINGVLYQLDINLNLNFITIISWFIPLVGTSLLLLFTYYFFNLREKYLKISLIVKTLIFINILLIPIHLYGFYVDKEYLKVTIFTGLTVGMSTISLFLIGLYMKDIGSKYFLLGQLVFLIAVALTALGVFGFITYHEYYRYLLTIGTSIDMILLLLAQYVKTKHTLDKLKKNKEMLIEQSHFSSIGQAIGNIAHQWKIPLTEVGTSFVLIETTLHHDKENLIKNLTNEMPKISLSIEHMKKSLDEFLHFYTARSIKEFFYPRETLSEVIHLLQSKITLKNTNINLHIKDEFSMNGHEHIFSNIMMILINNSLDEFNYENKNIITIHITSADDYIQITYTDNAGGIKIEPIEKAFEYFVSTKDEDGHGIGLAIIKLLIEDKLGGKIEVKNINEGVEFNIFIKE
ncbi:MAG: signal transduction histidine kinase [Sulfurimonas sp.]|uniref:sensor histidine kinase n=1 Tax=Sulfurimonas sp. TaxID=2022749 RepID=UPI0039E2B52E